MKRIYPIERELGRERGASWLSPADVVYQSILANEAMARAPEGIYGVFADLEQRDAHLFATLQTRKNALAGCQWQLVWPASAGATGEARAAIVRTTRQVLEAIPDFTGGLYHLLDALARGIAVAEILWRVERTTGRVEVARLVARQPWEFAFGTDGALYRLAADGFALASRRTRAAAGGEPQVELHPRPGEPYLSARGAERMPDRKFIVFVSQPEASAPYGTPLAARVYWYSWFKRQALQDWTQFNAKYGSPTPLARYAATTPPEEVERLAEALERLREQTGIVVPETMNVELLESRRANAGGTTFRELADWCNDEISKVILGQTLTTSEGRRSGSLALGRVHEAVRRDYLAADARALGMAIGRQLVRWIVDFNFGTDAPAPDFVFEIEEPGDDKAELEVDRGLVALGVPLDVEYFYRKYRRPVPAPGARKLKYDDANFYQYHLQYGVLTINEVREALGLARVSWGDRPPVKLAPSQSAEADATVADEPDRDSLEAHRDVLRH
jgi:phage gp29-like protein